MTDGFGTPEERADISRQFSRFSFANPMSVLRNIMDLNEENILPGFADKKVAESGGESSTEPLLSIPQDHLVPDLTVLAGMFYRSEFPACPKYRITHSNIDSCDFIVYLAQEQQSPFGYPSQLQARIEKPRRNNQLFCSAALQMIAHRKRPSAVPKVWAAGITETDTGVELHYMLSQHWDNVISLDQIWGRMKYPVQRALMQDVVAIITDLHSISVDDLDDEDWATLAEQPLDSNGVDDTPMVGNSQVGWFKDMASVLMARLAPGNAKYKMITNEDGSVVLAGNFSDSRAAKRFEVMFTPHNLALLLDACGLCHNDVEPRNILIRPQRTDFGPGYEFVGITNFDSAGFFPFAYEVVTKDNSLGMQNRMASWYDLYREMTQDLIYKNPDVPGAGSQEKMIQAVTLSDIAVKQTQGFHVGNRVQKKWLARQGYVRGQTAQEGYTRPDGHQVMYISEADLEKEALRDLGYL